MLDWIAGYVARWAPIVGDAARNLVQWGLHALASVVYTVFGHVGGAWLTVFDSISWFIKWLPEYCDQVLIHLTNLITVDLPAIWAYALSNVKQLIHDVASAIEAAAAYALRLYHQAVNAIDALNKWVLEHVLVPLSDAVTSVRNDLLKWGYFAYQLLNNPGKLAGILASAMVSALIAIFWSAAPLVLRFISGVVLKDTKRFVQLIEDVLSAVL